MKEKKHCPNIYDDDRTYSLSGFGLARVKQEGAPMHPEDLDWEHPPGSGCKKCYDRYQKQLEAYNNFYKDK